MHKEYVNAVELYFRQLFEVLVPLQSAYGGPIIAFQLENEYGGYEIINNREGKEYMTFLFQVGHVTGRSDHVMYDSKVSILVSLRMVVDHIHAPCACMVHVLVLALSIIQI